MMRCLNSKALLGIREKFIINTMDTRDEIASKSNAQKVENQNEVKTKKILTI